VSRPDRAPRLGGDGGQVAGIEALPFGVLIFVVGALLITNLWAVIDTKIAVDAAAREAVRTYVEAPDASAGQQRAGVAAAEVIQGYGRRPEKLAMTVHHDGERPFARCVRVTITTRYPVPALRLPWIGGLGHLFDVHGSHSERIDPFRTGLNGSGSC
jgi:hypothetical protein